MTTQQFAIIGASGKTGARVKQGLESLGHTPRALSRQSQPGFDWTQPDSWFTALQGVDSLYITYQPDLAVPRAERDIDMLVSVARHAGVKHLVLLSGRGEPGAQRAEQRIQHSGLAWNVIRAGWFMQNFSESFMLEGVLDRHVVLPEVQSREPFIDAEDIADMVVAALTREQLRNQLFEVTGPALLSFAECVAGIAQAIEQPIRYQSVPLDDYLAFARNNGMPDDIAWLMRELFSEVLDGRNEFVTDSVATVLGRPARAFHHYAARTAASGIWNPQQAMVAQQ